MNRCSRCNQPSPNALLCEECQNQLRRQFRHISLPPVPQTEQVLGGNATEPSIAVLPEQRADSSDLSVHVTGPQPVVSVGSVYAVGAQGSDENGGRAVSGGVGSLVPAHDPTERVIDRLSKAAQRIAEEEAVEPIPHKRPRASRLAPLRDISADIRRESTPSLGALSIAPSASDQFPNIVDTPESTGAENVGAQSIAPSEQDQDLGQQMPDLWPWLLEPDPEESEADTWANRTDPLTLRHFPSSSEAARIEEADIRRAMAEGVITAPVPPARRRRARSSRLRLVFVLLTILAIVALVVDGILLGAALLRPHRNDARAGGPATLTLSTHTARIGDTVIAHISHFAPSTRVLLTHDIEEPVQLAPSSSTGKTQQSNGASITLDANGNANVSIVIDKSWGPGFHPLNAEDATTHYTASAQLQIIDDGQTVPSRLLIDPLPQLLHKGTLLNMGADYQGASTILLLTLRNSGDGTPIAWTASSNRPWLMIAPTSGIFSATQTISIAVDRTNLKPGTYHDGVITLSSNVGAPPPIAVEMSVKPLPANPGPVLAITPAVLSFTANDGGPNPTPASLTISNPGTQPLPWSLAGNNPVTSSNGISSVAKTLGVQTNWLSTSVTSGIVLPHASQSVQVNVNSRSLLPGTYTSKLVFSSNGKAYNNVQAVNVSLTVQPQCGLTTSTGSLSFTAVVGQSNPTNQPLSLTTTPSCAASVAWSAMSSESWLSVTPNKGSLNGTGSTVTSIAVNASGLAPSPTPYTATLAFVTKQSTQTVAVQLSVQPKPPAAAPIIALSGLTLNFSNTQGPSASSGQSQSQIVTISNNGGGTLYWRTSATQFLTRWLGDYPSGGAIPPGKTEQLSVNVNTAGLTPGTYVGQISLNGRDANNHPASGSPQTITVNLLVLPPCLLAPASSSALVFNAVSGGQSPAPQTISIAASGNCSWPLNIHTSISSGAPWLSVTSSATSIGVSGQSISLTVAPHIDGLSAVPAPYTAQVTISATDSAGIAAQGSPQTFSVSLNVAPSVSPCQFSVSGTSLTFTAPNAAPQLLTLSESGSCAYPVSWNATTDTGSSTWLTLSSSSGEDTGTTSTLTVSANPTSANLAPGTYTGKITLSATNAGGTALQGSPQTVTVTLTVPGFTVSGAVFACADPTCSTPTPLPDAIISVLTGSTQITTTTTDASGNYTLSSLAPGAYTLTVSGTDSNGTHYTGTLTLTVTADQTNVSIDAIMV